MSVNRRRKILKRFIFLIIFLHMGTMVCASDYSAGGTYLFNSTDETLTLDYEISNYPSEDDGPQTKSYDYTNVTVTEYNLTMTDENDDSTTYSRSSGSADDIDGIWTNSDDEDIKLIFITNTSSFFMHSDTQSGSSSSSDDDHDDDEDTYGCFINTIAD